MYKLHFDTHDGSKLVCEYDPHTSEINGIPLTNLKDKQFRPINKISPENPGRKVSNVSRLKIQLGLQCNFDCPYCLQRSQIADATHSRLSDAKIFIANLDKWLTSSPNKIEFWGGEPMLYWKKIAYLLPILREKFPQANFSIVTNGSLLTQEIIDTICEYDIGIAISHDGPGQYIRGPDPFDDPGQYAMIRELILRRPKMNNASHKVAFNSVLTPNNFDFEKIEAFFRERFGGTVAVNLEGVVVAYNGSSEYVFTADQYKELSQSIAKVCMRDWDKIPMALQSKMSNFMSSLSQKRSSDYLSQKCGMDREDQLAVDLLGNVMTCQNTGAQGKHRIGHVLSLDKVRLNTSWHWSHRKECSGCPVLQLCAGSCMYVEGKEWFHSCNNEYFYNVGIMVGAFYHMSGKKAILTKIEGEIVRPDPNEYGI